MVWQPEMIEALSNRLPQMSRMWDILRGDISIARKEIGNGRLKWLRELPEQWLDAELAVVHASPGDKWNSPTGSAGDEDFVRVYGHLGRRTVVYGHVHVPFVRRVAGFTIANSGAVGLPLDGDPRATYLLLDGSEVSIRRVAYDVEKTRKMILDVPQLGQHLGDRLLVGR